MNGLALSYAWPLRPRARLVALMASVRRPLHAWSARRRRCVSALLAVVVFAAGTAGWRMSDADGLDASRAALRAATRRLNDARQTTAALPALRSHPGATLPRAASPARPAGAAEAVRVIARLAAHSGLVLVSLEPAAVTGVGDNVMRPMRLVARSDFRALHAFLHGLTSLPMLAVPDDLLVKRTGHTLNVSAVLQVFGALMPAGAGSGETSGDESMAPLRAAETAFVPDDPFEPGARFITDDATDTGARLVGTLLDQISGVALFDLAERVEELEPGQWLGDERLTRVGELDVTLQSDDSVRTLGFPQVAT